MKKIKLYNKDLFASVDDEDFDHLNQFRWVYRDGYTHRLEWHNGKQKSYAMHREVLKADKTQIVDHKNQDGLDNQKSNLRFCSRSENAMNCKVHKHNTSGYKGVSFLKSIQKWRSYIVFKNKQITIGYFINKIDAAKAYNSKALEIFGEFASLNIIKD